MENICEQCGRSFLPCPSVPNQKFCGKECAKERRRFNQKARLAGDPDYRDNQRFAQREWRERNPGYMREYRKKHPGYIRRNRIQQRRRNKIRQKGVSRVSVLQSPLMIVKMTELEADSIYVPGPYRVTFLKGEVIVKMDEFNRHPVGVSGVSEMHVKTEG